MTDIANTGSHVAPLHTAFSWLGTLRSRFTAWHRERARLKTDRLAFETLLRLDDETLEDIGYTRKDVVRASKLPLEMNAAEQLRRNRIGVNLR